jgi:NAD(P)-dependent dehydrogenase (short-subunit alcohol dehydrogenase family)
MDNGAEPGVAIVTGAASGIGNALARRLLAAGHVVVGVDIGPCDLPVAVVHDVADVENHDALVARIEQEHGAVTMLANVAGTFISESVADLTPANVRRQLAIMLEGPVFLARAAGVRMARRGGGRIVNVSSVHASNSEPLSLAYDAAKGGLEAATRTLAIELGPHGVLVNAVAPGFTRTPLSIVDGQDELESDWFRGRYQEGGLLPVRRAAEADEIAAAIAFLLSGDNTYVNGARLVVDGGLTVTF